MHLVGLLIYTLQYDARCIQRQKFLQALSHYTNDELVQRTSTQYFTTLHYKLSITAYMQVHETENCHPQYGIVVSTRPLLPVSLVSQWRKQDAVLREAIIDMP